MDLWPNGAKFHVSFSCVAQALKHPHTITLQTMFDCRYVLTVDYFDCCLCQMHQDTLISKQFNTTTKLNILPKGLRLSRCFLLKLRWAFMVFWVGSSVCLTMNAISDRCFSNSRVENRGKRSLNFFLGSVLNFETMILLRFFGDLQL